jgi:hypothetical protein
VLALTGINRVRHFRTGLDTAVCRGFYLSAQNADNHFVRIAGGRVVVTARGLNRCWERFVYIKELMHLFDKGDSATDTGDAFDALLSEFIAPGATASSKQMESEAIAFWRALAAFCPEKLRLELKDERDHNRIDDYAIALRLRIPEQYVPCLFDQNYERTMTVIGVT